MPDPVYAAIEAHRSAFRGWDRAWESEESAARKAPDSFHHEAAIRAREQASAAERGAFANLLGTPPTTLAGILALIDYLKGPECFDDGTVEGADFDAAADCIAASIRAMIGEGV